MKGKETLRVIHDAHGSSASNGSYGSAQGEMIKKFKSQPKRAAASTFLQSDAREPHTIALVDWIDVSIVGYKKRN